MNIELNTTQLAALEGEARARSTVETPITAETVASSLLCGACDSYAAAHSDADKQEMAVNGRLMAQPDKRPAIEAAVQSILQGE